jgi:AmmeMemoRadiSam system protein B
MKNGRKIILIIGAAAVLIVAALWLYADGVVVETQNFASLRHAGVIVPHHELANSLIDEFYQRLRSENENIKTFIILAPNHKNVGNAPVIVGLRDWKFGGDKIAVDTQVVGALRATPLPLGVDEKNILVEHGISVQLPFIKKYFPDARIVPLAFSTKLKTAESFALAQTLKNILQDENVFMIASLDFSHYLPLTTALQKDKETMVAMKNFDYEKISRFGSDNVDSPQALITFLRTMELLDAKKITELAHKNSSDFLAGAVENVTTYFCWLFGK